MVLAWFLVCCLVTILLTVWYYQCARIGGDVGDVAFEYRLSYCKIDQTVRLDNKYIVCKFNKGSCNQLFFEYLFAHEGRPISRSELTQQFGHDFLNDRSYSHFLSSNFYKDIRTAFFLISGDHIRVNTRVLLDKRLKLF